MKRLVLAGAGHAHALVLRALVREPLRGVEVVVVSPQPLAPYSGMVPGWLAGRYRFEDITVDVPALAAAAGARWLPGELESLDPSHGRLRLSDGTVLDHDLLSLNVGSTLDPPPVVHARLLPLRPLALLHERVEALWTAWQAAPDDRPFVVTAVGGGAAGVEALLAVLARLRTLRPQRTVQGRLITRSAVLLPGFPGAARSAAQRALDRAGVSVRLAQGWTEADDHDSDAVLWATGAQAHAWQRDPARRGGLAVDEQGFIRIDEHLRSVSHPRVFAAGDCASWPRRALPKAGVHAVRMGPVLAANLRAALGEGGRVDALKVHRPQRRALALLATGDGRAIATRGPLAAEGAWAWHWKDHIDRRFLRQFLTTPGGPPPARAADPVADASAPSTGEPR